MTRAWTLVAQFLGWPAAAGLAWLWLSMPEGTVWQLAASGLLAIGLCGLVAALIAGALGRWGAALRVLPWLAAAAALSAAVLWRGLDPNLTALPWMAALPAFYWAAGGPNYVEMLRRPSTYCGVVLWAAVALAIPAKLISWAPDVGAGMAAQAASAGARFTLAGVLFVLAWLGLGSYWRKEVPAAQP
jgi:hypothetical protein